MSLLAQKLLTALCSTCSVGLALLASVLYTIISSTVLPLAVARRIFSGPNSNGNSVESKLARLPANSSRLRCFSAEPELQPTRRRVEAITLLRTIFFISEYFFERFNNDVGINTRRDIRIGIRPSLCFN
ncbi:Uncharacterised protein [Vibrio cholerae]|nr:Uncharacterised protein [Vibrio cholerae]